MAASGCCDISRPVTASANCGSFKGGAYNVRIACYKMLASITVAACSSGSPSGRVVSDFITDDPVTPVGGPTYTPALYTVAIKKDTAEQIASLTFSEDTSSVRIDETFNLSIEGKDTDTYCSMKDWIGQQVLIFYQERNTSDWFVAGWTGGFYVTTIEMGTGTNEYKPITVVVQGNDVDDFAIRVFDTDAATTQALIDSFTEA